MKGKMLQWMTVALVAVITAIAAPRPAMGQGWYSSWGAGVSAAKSSGKPMIVVFEQEGCPDCARMNSVMAGGRVRQALRNAVKVRLEYNDNRNIGSRFGINATPTLLLFSPDTGFGDFLFREEGAMSAGALVSLGRQVDSLCPSAAKPGVAKPAANVATASTAVQPASPRQSARAARKRRSTVREIGVPYAFDSANPAYASQPAPSETQTGNGQTVYYYYY